MAATERPGATGRGYGVPPLSVAELVEEARKISAREVARDRQLRENQGAWSGNSAFELEAPFATRHGKLLPQETLRPKRLLTGRPHFDGAFAPEAYPSARGASPPAPVGRETRLYVVRLRDGKFFVGTFRVAARGAADLSNLHARIEAHRRGDCQWTRRYPPAEGDDALYWFQREEKNPSRDSMGVVDTDALAERLMFERHARHGLDVVRGGSYTAAHMPDHRKRALADAFFLRDDIACAVCGGAHASKRCGERREAARVYATWRRKNAPRDDDDDNDDDDDLSCAESTGSQSLEPYADDEEGSEGRAFARETLAAFDARSSASEIRKVNVSPGEKKASSASKAGDGASSVSVRVSGRTETPAKWTLAEESDLLRALHAGFGGASEIARLARERGRTEQDVMARIRVLRKRV
jgi:hypothetical protein